MGTVGCMKFWPHLSHFAIYLVKAGNWRVQNLLRLPQKKVHSWSFLSLLIQSQNLSFAIVAAADPQEHFYKCWLYF